uniref:Putative product n=1 Tax=Xenopsylla cheopis TaxID=163159 RepID=A0A6M2E1T7_XENCH
MKCLLILTILAVLHFQSIQCGWGGSRVNSTKIGTNGGRTLINKYISAEGQGNSGPKFDGRRGVGFSAWGIIGIIVGGILAIMGIYYTSVFYPILCKKERRYDKMHGISNV